MSRTYRVVSSELTADKQTVVKECMICSKNDKRSQCERRRNRVDSHRRSQRGHIVLINFIRT